MRANLFPSSPYPPPLPVPSHPVIAMPICRSEYARIHIGEHRDRIFQFSDEVVNIRFVIIEIETCPNTPCCIQLGVQRLCTVMS